MRGYAKQQLSFAEGFLDPISFTLDDELKQIDHLLNERKLLAPFIEVFHGSMGRPGTPVDVYLRMMYLKFRYDLGYEDLQTQVRERLTWRRFCHLSLADKVPDATTLIKLNKRFGEERIKKLNQKLVKALLKEKSITPRRIRLDSTTLEANVGYPTDVRLIHQVVKTLTRTARGLGQKITSHVCATKKALARLGASLKSRGKERRVQALKTLKQVNRLAQETVAESRQVLNKLRKTAKAPSVPTTQHSLMQEQFAEQINLAEQILEQTQQKRQCHAASRSRCQARRHRESRALDEAREEHQHKKWFKELQGFRRGIEACISMLKRKFSLGRVLSRGLAGTAIWVGFSIFSYNLWQMTK